MTPAVLQQLELQAVVPRAVRRRVHLHMMVPRRREQAPQLARALIGREGRDPQRRGRLRCGRARSGAAAPRSVGSPATATSAAGPRVFVIPIQQREPVLPPRGCVRRAASMRRRASSTAPSALRAPRRGSFSLMMSAEEHGPAHAAKRRRPRSCWRQYAAALAGMSPSINASPESPRSRRRRAPGRGARASMASGGSIGPAARRLRYLREFLPHSHPPSHTHT